MYNYGVKDGGFSEPRIQTVISVPLVEQEDRSLAKGDRRKRLIREEKINTGEENAAALSDASQPPVSSSAGS